MNNSYKKSNKYSNEYITFIVELQNFSNDVSTNGHDSYKNQVTIYMRETPICLSNNKKKYFFNEKIS